MRTLAGAIIGLLVCAAPAAAQPYVYGVTGSGFFNGLHFTQTDPARLVTIDAATGQAIASLTLPGCNQARGLAVRADGLRVYVACEGMARGVVAVDPVGKQIVGTRALTAAPGGIAITASGDRLVVPTRSDRAEVLDAVSLSTIATIITGSDFEERIPVVISPDSSTAYFARTNLGLLRGAASRVIFGSLTDFTATDMRLVPPGAGALALTPDGSRLVVGGQVVSIMNTATRTVVATYDPVQTLIGMVAVAADATRAYVAETSLLVIDLASGALTAEWPIASAGALELSPAGDRLYAANAGTFNVIDTATGGIVTTGVARNLIDLAAPAASPLISPDACSYAVRFRPGSFSSPPPRESPSGSTDWRIDVIALPDRCTWTAQSDVAWIALERGSGTGPDNVGITIAPNATGLSRTGTIAIGGQSLSITQAGCTNPIVFFERPIPDRAIAQPFMVSGWAIDTCSSTGTGISEIGATGYGRARPDVAAAFGGSQFTNSGFEFVDTFERRPGVQDITVAFRDTLTDAQVLGTVRANVLPSIAPFGAIDTPEDAATVSGDMPLTGWVMDDVALFGNVLIYRDAMPGEFTSPATPGKVFVGVATRIAGARPDVQALFPQYAENDRAGFGAMILTNALPNGGNGTFTFHVQLADRYHTTWLGPRTVTVDNANSPLPFGAVDTPAPGQTVSGVITVHGWALTPGTAMIPLDGSTIDVIVDGQVVGHPTYNQARPDVQALFPGYTNAAAPGGSFTLDTSTLSNGTHTIAWVVRDSAGNAKGIGSRFFTVQN